MKLNDAQCKCFDEGGYIQLEGLIEGEELSQLQEEFTRVEEATREDWRRQLVEGIDHDGYGIGETAHVVMPVAPHSDITGSHSEWHRDGEKIDGNRSTAWPYHRAHEWSAQDRQAWERMRACETPYMKIRTWPIRLTFPGAG